MTGMALRIYLTFENVNTKSTSEVVAYTFNYRNWIVLFVGFHASVNGVSIAIKIEKETLMLSFIL